MDRETIAKVAKVARLALTDEEMERYAQDLDAILNSFAVLDEAPASDTYALNPVPVVDVLREDEPMDRHVSWRAGGAARVFYQPADVADLQSFLATRPPGEPVLITKSPR